MKYIWILILSFVFFSSFKLTGDNVEVSDHVHKFVLGNPKSVAGLVGHVILWSSRYNQLLDVKQGTWFLGQGTWNWLGGNYLVQSQTVVGGKRRLDKIQDDYIFMGVWKKDEGNITFVLSSWWFMFTQILKSALKLT